MKKGFFKSIPALIMGLSLMQLSGCASLFELTAEEGDYDRGFQAEADEGYQNADSCLGDTCHTEADPFDYEANERTRSYANEGDNRVRRAIETRDVILGMTRQDVMASWGEPVQKEVAGRGGSGHERWTYGTRYSLGQSKSRTVIFENGKVAGWHR